MARLVAAGSLRTLRVSRAACFASAAAAPGAAALAGAIASPGASLTRLDLVSTGLFDESAR